MTKKLKRSGIVVLLFVLAVSFCLFAFSNVNTKATEGIIAETYKVGETLVIPSRTLSNSSGNANADIILYYPDGTAVATSKVTFKDPGQYTVEYRAKIGGQLVKETQSFKVVQNAYSVSGENSTIRYGKDDSNFNTGLVGLDVALAESETFNVNKVIDLKQFDGKSFLNFNLTPQTKGTRDASAMWIRLTDIHDSSNYLSIKIQSVAFNGAPYVYSVSYALAAPCGQSPIAQDYSDINRIHVNDRFGQAVYTSFYGNAETVGSNYNPTGQDPVGIIYKPEEKQLWISSYSATLMIADFDDPKYTKYLPQDAWSGFTSDEVMLSIEATGYVGSHFNFIITKLADFDLEESEFVDDEAPVITVNTSGYSEDSLPLAVKGKTYPVFDATAFDLYSGERTVNVRAYYAYDTNGRAELQIKDEKISIDRNGVYALVYTATDRFGNVSEKVLRFATGTTENPAISLSSATGEGKVGYAYALPSYDVSKGSGNLAVTITATKPNGGTEVITDTFIPRSEGVYTLVYTVTDVTGRTESANHTVTVVDDSLPVFGEVSCPEYLIYGQSYDFDLPSAYVYGTDSYVQSELYVDGQKASNPFTPTAVGDIKVKYVAKNSVGSSQTDEFTVKVIKVTETVDGEEKLAFSKYFDATDFTVSQEEGCVSFTANAKTGDSGEIKYIKSLMTHRFELGIKIDTDKNQFGRLQILLTDANNQDNQLKIELVKVDSGTVYYVNGKNTQVSVKNGGFTGGKTLQLSYNDGKILDGGSLSLKISEIFSAIEYDISLKLLDITGDAQVSLTNINGQVLTSTFNVSNHKPQFKVNGDYPEQLDLNSVLTVNSLSVQDVLDTQVSATVTVSGPSGKLLGNANGFESHEITLSEYGSYRITYTVYNCTGRSETYRLIVNVLDMEIPQITVNGEIKESYKVGDGLKLPTMTVTDNISAAEDVEKCILVNDPAGTLYVCSSETLTFDKAGEWTIKYYAQDEAGNIALKVFKIKVA